MYHLISHLCLEKSAEVEFSTFLSIMHRQMQQEDPKVEILEALKMTDKQKKGYIEASELRAKLTMLGEKLTNKEGRVNEVSNLWDVKFLLIPRNNTANIRWLRSVS